MDQKIGQRKVLASANSHNIQCEHHLVAGLFVCGKSLLTGRRGRRPLQVCGKSLLEKRFILRVLDFKAAVAKEVEEAGKRNPTFREAKMSRFACKQAKLWLF